MDLPDSHGLINAFLFRPGEAPAHLGWAKISRLPAVARGGFAWLHFSLTDVRTQDWMVNGGLLPAAAAEHLSASDSRIRIERVGEGIIGVLGDLYHDFDSDPQSIGLVRFYIGPGLLVTARRHPLKAIDKLRREIAAGAKVDSPLSLLAHLFQQFAATIEGLIGGLDEQIDAIEDRVLTGHFHREGGELARIRRLMSRVRRRLVAERHAIAAIAPTLPSWCSESDSAQLRSTLGRLQSIAQDLEASYERGRVLHEEIGNRLQEATNRNMYVLTIATTVFLPISFITGIFQLNTGGLPLTKDDFGFWWVMIGILATAVVTVWLLRRWRLF